MRALLLLLVPTAASAAPSVMSGQYSSAVTVHLAGQRGAINRRLDYEVMIRIEGTKAGLVESGRSHEHNLYPDYSTDDDIAWTGTWNGTAKQTSTTLVLELTQSSRPCTHVHKSRGFADQTKPCGAATKSLKLECTSQTVRLDERSSLSREIWRCSVTAGELPLAPSIVVGKTACVRVLGNHRKGTSSDRYQACTP